MNMLRMAATGEITSSSSQPCPNTSDSVNRFLQRPDKAANDTPLPRDPQQAEEMITAAQLSSTLPFKVPEHDTIIRGAHSRLASSQSSRPGSAFQQALQQELDQQAECLSLQLKSRSAKGRPRSSSLASRPLPTDIPFHHPPPRGRTHSWSTGIPDVRNEPLLPPPPVKVRVTREVLNTTPSSSRTPHRYLSQWTNSQ